MIIEYKGKRPKIGKNVFIAPNATLIGDVTIGDNSSVWYHTVIRGDGDAVVIGENTNVQDNCTLHVDEGSPITIGNFVTVGHNAVVHGCLVADYCLIGIHATVLNGATLHKGSVVAANAVVMEGQTVGPFHLVAGVPAVLKKNLPEAVLEMIRLPADIYVQKAKDYKEAKIITP